MQAAATGSTEEVLTSFPAVTLDRQLTLGPVQFVTPPDNGLAVGPNHVVEMVNSSGTIWNKSGGDPIQLFDLNKFFLVPSTYSFSDPRVLYDQMSQRWFASGVAFVTPSFGSLIVIAVSKDSDPTGTWFQYSADNSSNVTHDQPKFGVSDDKFVISWNDFLSAQFFQGASTWIFEKSQMVAGSSSVNGAAIGPDSTKAALVPAVQLSSGSPAYIAYNNSDCSTLGCNKGSPTFGLIVITGTPLGGNLALNEADPAIAATSQPPNADQPGLPASIATNDDRFLTAIWQNGILWTGGNDACVPAGDSATRPCSRLIQVLTAGSTINQSFDIASMGSGLYYPAFAMDAGGSMYVVYNISSINQNVGVRITGQRASAPIQTVASAQTIKAGETTYDMNPCFGTAGASRWGDYAGAAIDPQNPTDVWVASEYAAIGTTTGPPSDAGCAWGTFAGRLTFSAPAVTSISPTSGSASTVVTVNGTDFFALGTTVSFGGTAATNVIVTSPNQLTATAPSGCGTVDVTITTPDGTSAISPADQFTFSSTCGGDFTISASPTSLSVQQGGSGTSAVSTTLVGSAGTVNLRAGVSPPGPTASLSPAAVSAGSSSTLTVNVGASVATGTYTVTATGTEGTNTHSTTVTVTVTAAPPPPDFTISASPTSLSIQQGGSGNSTIATTLVGTAGTVNLSAGVSPSGPTAALSSAAVSAGSSSTLTVNVGASVATGAYIVTVTGSEGSNTHSTTVTVTVTAPPPPPDFAISASPTSRTVTRGGGTTYIVTITRTSGFTGAITLSASGLPNRASARFNPNNTTGNSSTMSVSTSSRTPRGTYLLTITAASGGLRHSTTVTLVVR